MARTRKPNSIPQPGMLKEVSDETSLCETTKQFAPIDSINTKIVRPVISRRESLKTLLLTGSAVLITRQIYSEETLKYAVVDRRNASSPIEYRLIVTARKSGETVTFPGHAFLLAGEYDLVQKVCRFDNKKIFGFYPAEDSSKIKTMFAFPVPGVVRGKLESDLNQHLITQRLDIQVAQNGYDAAAGVAQIYAKQNPYEIGKTDCVAFTQTMLNAVLKATDGAPGKLTVPTKNNYQTPEAYLTELLKANGS